MTFNFIIALNNKEIYDNYIGESLAELKNILARTRPDIVINQHLILTGSSIFDKYNKGIEFCNVIDTDFYIFVHEDVKLDLSKPISFLNDIIDIFKKDKMIGILGIAGTTSFSDKGGWWLTEPENTFGHWLQGHPNGATTYNRRNLEFRSDLVSVDGCCMIVPGYVLKNIKFDNINYPNSYHFYDVDFCFTCLEHGYKIAISNILIEHASEGPLSSDWVRSRDLFLEKWLKKGLKFPVTTNQFKNKGGTKSEK